MAEFPNSPLANCKEEQSQVEVCNFCGDRGFTNALINCSECCETLVHQYCLGIPPGSIDDNFNWICEFCCAEKESELHLSMTSVGASTKGKRKKRERSPSIPQSERPLTLGSKCKRIRKEKTEDQSLSSSTTKVAICKSSNSEDDMNISSLVEHKMDCSSSCKVYCDDSTDEMPLDYGGSSIILVEEQPVPLLTLRPIGNNGSLEKAEKIECGSNNNLLDCWEESEGGISSLMEEPEEIMRGIVLLVSPSGEIFIHEDSVYCDEDLGLYELALDSAFPTFGKMVDENGQIGETRSFWETDMIDVARIKRENVREGEEEIEGLEGEPEKSSEELKNRLKSSEWYFEDVNQIV